MAVLESPLLQAVEPTRDESEAARHSGLRLAEAMSQAMSQAMENGAAEIVLHRQDGSIRESVQLPASALRLLARLLTEMGEGHAIAVVPIEAEVSTQEAAELLNVSRPYVVRLLDEGQIPARKVGTHRRAKLRDVLEFKQRDTQRRLDIAAELTALSQEMGLY